MKTLSVLAFLLSLNFTSAALTQPVATPTVPSQSGRTERHEAGREAARNFKPGEGDPEPPAKATASAEQKEVARGLRNSEGADAATAFRPGDGNQNPIRTVTMSKQDRVEARAKQRAETRAANKAGTIPNYGEGYGGNQK